MVNSLSSLIMRYIFVCIKNWGSTLGNYKLYKLPTVTVKFLKLGRNIE